jgi:ribosome maturation factor RimP
VSTRNASAAHHPADRAAARLTAAVEPVVAAAGYDLEELMVRAAGQRSVVRVVVDRDSGVSLDDVAELSRSVSEALDADGGDLGRSSFVLEVTSPGVDRPLTLPRHWRRNTGRLVTVPVGPGGAGEQLTGRVLQVTDQGVVLAVEKGGVKKGQVRRAVGERSVAWAELGAGRVQIEFTRPAGHRDAGLVATVPDDEVGSDDEDLADDDLAHDDMQDDLNDEHDPSGSGGEQ